MKEEEEIRQNVVTRVSTKDNTGMSNYPNEGLQSELLIKQIIPYSLNAT